MSQLRRKRQTLNRLLMLYGTFSAYTIKTPLTYFASYIIVPINYIAQLNCESYDAVLIFYNFTSGVKPLFIQCGSYFYPFYFHNQTCHTMWFLLLTLSLPESNLGS